MTHPDRFETPADVMRHAIELARCGLGRVEPNPAVGAVLVDADSDFLAHGFHQAFGGPHAEINALSDLTRRVPDPQEQQRLLANATLYVTLEPCCHHGKTPPCTDAIIQSGIPRVVYGLGDPSPHVAGGGKLQLTEAGVQVTNGLLQDDMAALNAPFLQLLTSGRPWVHAKWAMTLDGRIAAHTGVSKWISSEASRAVVHELRGRMDAVIVGANTARLDDPLLTARPPGPRTPFRIVVDSRALLSVDSQLARTVEKGPVLVATGRSPDSENVTLLQNLGVEVLPFESPDDRVDLNGLLAELGRRSMTNVLVEGGSGLLGSLFDQNLANELHVFIAPKIVGGAEALSAVGGEGVTEIPQLGLLKSMQVRSSGDDVYIHGVVDRCS
jgi:diaminohydroxyphosphoribosylaminopyrimidine deaminase/5-amino-6-(5-phosphoribosylamino)uracil reductase